jgi:hypothetical protein
MPWRLAVRCHKGKHMAKKHDRLAFIGLVLAIAAIAAALTAWAAALKPANDLPSEATYRPQYSNVY